MKWGSLVYIEWHDHTSCQDHRWRSTSEIKGLRPLLMKTVGWVLKETKEYVTIVSTSAGHTHWGEMCIIKSAIIKRMKLKC